MHNQQREKPLKMPGSVTGKLCNMNRLLFTNYNRLLVLKFVNNFINQMSKFDFLSHLGQISVTAIRKKAVVFTLSVFMLFCWGFVVVVFSVFIICLFCVRAWVRAFVRECVFYVFFFRVCEESLICFPCIYIV